MAETIYKSAVCSLPGTVDSKEGSLNKYMDGGNEFILQENYRTDTNLDPLESERKGIEWSKCV